MVVLPCAPSVASLRADARRLCLWINGIRRGGYPALTLNGQANLDSRVGRAARLLRGFELHLHLSLNLFDARGTPYTDVVVMSHYRRVSCQTGVVNPSVTFLLRC